MEKFVNVALLGVMATMSSGIYSKNRFHVFLYNYTPYKVEGTAYFENCTISIQGQDYQLVDWPFLDPAPAKRNDKGEIEATMARADVTDCNHTGMDVTVTKPDGTKAHLHYNLKVSDHVWYEIKEISSYSPTTHSFHPTLILTYSKAPLTSTDMAGNQIWLRQRGEYQMRASERIVDQENLD